MLHDALHRFNGDRSGQSGYLHAFILKLHCCKAQHLPAGVSRGIPEKHMPFLNLLTVSSETCTLLMVLVII